MSDPILKVEHLSMKFGGLVAIGDLSFEARRGEITALIGPNGAGKTTVFNCITGFYKPSEGMITLRRQDGAGYLLERLPDYQITRNAKVARTFQNIRLFSGMTVLENLLVAQHNVLMRASGYTFLGLFGFASYKRASAESMDKAKFWLNKVDLTDRADDPAGDLPYGAQRRLEIARAMCTEPELLCLDEPAAGLNPKESLALNQLLLDIKKDTGTSILLIEHDMSVVMQISDHVVVLEYGRKISDGDPDSVKSDPKVIAAYLGVDDEEVTEVLSEVGDESVIEELDGEPGPSQAPSVSSSLMAGPISDTVGHADAGGEVVRVSPGASKAARVEAGAGPARTGTATPAGKAEASGIERAPAAGTGGRAPSGRASRTAAASPAAGAAKKTGPAASSTKASASGTAKPAKPSAASAASARTRTATASGAAAPAAGRPAAAQAAGKGRGSAAAGRTPARLSNALAAPRGGKPDRLIEIKGIGPVNEKKLNEHGIFHFDQIAAWRRADIEAAEAYLAFDGRIDREDWIGQAKTFAKRARADAAPKTRTTKRGGRG
ncbi:MAG: ATP-binding cassette domain-containing protein [Rhizobiales bacterium]|nr:ATP-binding cassette domain-containing protein [Hyphomicrobiales bacterium]